MGRRLLRPEKNMSLCDAGYFFEIGTEARVVPQSRFMVPPLPDFSKEMVKFSTGDGRVETVISTRARSLEAPG